MTDDAVREADVAERRALGREQSFDGHVAKLIKVFEEVAAAKTRRGTALRRSSPGAREVH